MWEGLVSHCLPQPLWTGVCFATWSRAESLAMIFVSSALFPRLMQERGEGGSGEEPTLFAQG